MRERCQLAGGLSLDGCSILINDQLLALHTVPYVNHVPVCSSSSTDCATVYLELNAKSLCHVLSASQQNAWAAAGLAAANRSRQLVARADLEVQVEGQRVASKGGLRGQAVHS